MLFVVEGEGVLETDGRAVGFGAGSLAFDAGDEELLVSNEGRIGLTLPGVPRAAVPAPRCDR